MKLSVVPKLESEADRGQAGLPRRNVSMEYFMVPDPRILRIATAPRAAALDSL
jgi:hypothetical protein